MVSVFEPSDCLIVLCLFDCKFSHFPSPHPPLIVLTPLLFIYKIIAVKISIDTSSEWIAMYGPVQYSTVQYSTVHYITTVIIDICCWQAADITGPLQVWPMG